MSEYVSRKEMELALQRIEDAQRATEAARRFLDSVVRVNRQDRRGPESGD